ncbi:MAG: hypothetical protein R2864_04325 [Syntrophotaleaceae bacterium]
MDKLLGVSLQTLQDPVDTEQIVVIGQVGKGDFRQVADVPPGTSEMPCSGEKQPDRVGIR